MHASMRPHWRLTDSTSTPKTLLPWLYTNAGTCECSFSPAFFAARSSQVTQLWTMQWSWSLLGFLKKFLLFHMKVHSVADFHLSFPIFEWNLGSDSGKPYYNHGKTKLKYKHQVFYSLKRWTKAISFLSLGIWDIYLY